jgi:hypothetical protein
MVFWKWLKTYDSRLMVDSRLMAYAFFLREP